MRYMLAFLQYPHSGVFTGENEEDISLSYVHFFFVSLKILH